MKRAPRSTTPRAAVLRLLREQLFSTPLNSLLTVAALAVFCVVVIPGLQWLFIDAQWAGRTPADCPDKSAACWPFVRARLDQFIYGLYPAGEHWRINAGFAAAVLCAVPLFISRFRHKVAWLGTLYVIYAAIGLFLFLGGWYGLTRVGTSHWGGFFLTLVTAFFVLATALPAAVLLALGRTSSIPLLKILCASWIEFWRSVPALAVLFVAIIMFPLFMPPGTEIDKLLRALLALSVLMSCYLAEALRGALQSIPRGQYECADALGLNYWQKTFRVILPQAFPVALPQITSNFIGLFKETTVLLVVGLFDLLGMVQNAASDPQWLSPGVSATGYVFVAVFFWVFCFSLSRYSAWLEHQATRYRAVSAETR